MDDLIKRQDAIDAISCNILVPERQNAELVASTIRTFADRIKALPSAQKTGEWIWVQYDANPEIGNWHCSVCRFMPASFNLAKKHLNYCPNCGAKMMEE